MKSRDVVSKAVGLLALFAVLACGGGGDEPEPTNPARVPGAPTGVTATPGDASATVTWTAPSDNGGSDITEYVVRALRAGATAKTQRSSSPSLTVTELTNGESYTFTVAAINAVGEGAASGASAAVVPRVVPGAPRNITATPGDRQITVTWEAPADNGMAITGYTVQVHEGDTLVTSQPAEGLSATITNLVNGTGYLVTVVASNSVVPGPTSDPVAVTPRTAPGAPQVSSDFALMSGTTNPVRVTLSWTVPDTGGSPVTGYSVVVKSGDVVVHSEETTATNVSFAKLINGTTYTATVVARNIAGEGTPSAPYVERLCGIASQPRTLLGTRGDGQMTLTWRAPTELSGCPITHYRVTVDAGDELWSFNTTELTATATGLVNGKFYRFLVNAHNGVTQGNSATFSGTTYTMPLAPTNFQATPEDGAVTLSWGVPDARGSAISGYAVAVSTGGSDPNYIYVDGGMTTTVRVEELTNGTTYTFSIVANSNAGDSDAATFQATPRASAP